eukprot:CAMPEP_0182451076 /NCGR_PEP_ID=MMETSP1172-20130603/43519_1 /TAXON_ID=708627 /ORGANISM="Timspurckia oligopyrenoides, Strain CCMP3278" /LENGTH=482 /DNA_ID=CAMNT_0024648811 /DNA_START=2076 /DNA_END=3524 /DNA_ORIENTATION=+
MGRLGDEPEIRFVVEVCSECLEFVGKMSTNGAFPYMPLVAAFEFGMTCFELYLTYRQKVRFESDKPAQILETVVPADKFIKAQEYGLAKCKFSMISQIVSSSLSLVFQFTFVYPKLWQFSLSVMQYFKPTLSAENEIIRTITFMILSSVLGSLTSLPFGLYQTFVLEQKFGFNRTTLTTYIKDSLMGSALSLVIGVPLITALWYVIDKSGPHLWLYFWLFLSSFSLFMAVLYPSVIAPLFNKFTPLEEGELKAGIDKLASSIGFPLKKLYVMDGSRRSTHSNAYFYGIFTKGIVLFDSLLDQCKGHDDRVLAVLCHELGHWKEGHTRKSLIIGLLHMLFMSGLYGMTASNKDLFVSFGYTSDTPHLIGLMLFSEILGPLDSIVSFAMNWMSRKHEYEADRFAKTLGHSQALGDALVSMHIENLSNMNPDPWYSMYHNSHPTLVERLMALGITPSQIDLKSEKEQDTNGTTAEQQDTESKKDQ